MADYVEREARVKKHIAAMDRLGLRKVAGALDESQELERRARISEQVRANRTRNALKPHRQHEATLPQRPTGPVLTDPKTWSNYYETRFQTRNPAPKWGDVFQHPDDGTRPAAPFMDMRKPDPDDYEESVIGWNAWQQKAQETVEVAAWMRENDVQISFSRGQGIAYVVVNGEPFTVELGEKDDEGSIQNRALAQCRGAASARPKSTDR